jgi:hypothetical protein
MDVSLIYELETSGQSDAGVDEALLFMQIYTTAHDAIMRSIEMIAQEKSQAQIGDK